MIIAILGRQPELSLAELSSLYPGKVTDLGAAALIDGDTIDIDRLGGTIKLAEVWQRYPTTGWPQFCERFLPEVLERLAGDGKLRYGLSLYGWGRRPSELGTLGKRIKVGLVARGIKARYITPNGLQLSSAQVTHNHLVEAGGVEIVIIRHPNGIIVGRTTAVQDIAAYTERDQARPERDSRVGMLPPKLAQMMLNLAAPLPGATILDPFCGSGVVLQEALLAGFAVIGSDLDPAMVQASEANLRWLAEHHRLPKWQVELQDATHGQWHGVQAVVTEGYLGPALTHLPGVGDLDELVQQQTDLTLASLANLHPQLPSDSPVVMALPAWRTPAGWRRLDIIDQIKALGYTQKQFLSLRPLELLYHRPDQLVGRDIQVLRSV